MSDKLAAAGSAGFGGRPPRRPPGRLWPLTVSETARITPHMRRVVFSGDTLDELDHKPAQDVVLIFPQPAGEPARRHYTVRWHDKAARRLAIDFVMHDETSPAMGWVLSAKPGDKIEAQGPRGQTVINPQADWHLFTGDETCLPGIFAMLESLPAGARAFAFIEVENEVEAQKLDAKADIKLDWIFRGGPAKPASPALIERFQSFQFPPGIGQAYIIGETSTVRAQRQGLIARGFDKARIAAEGYWRPGREGGHDHIRDENEGPRARPDFARPA